MSGMRYFSVLLFAIATLLPFLGSCARVSDGVPLLIAKNLDSALREFKDGDDDSIKAHWALLVAGSMGWGNYRHQADICHAYQLLRQGGLDDDHIIVMMYDDIADNIENPHPGKIFNRPGGPDVYKGVPKDYTKEHVNAKTVLSVLLGDEQAVAGKGSGKVVKSGPNDRVFVFYSDHGAPGILGMPSGPFLYADHLQKAIADKAAAGGFKEMVLYIEACESGSMFEGLLPDSIGVYATTAANAYESSWGTYCPGMDPAPPLELTTCLGDLYSVSWMENADEADLASETLKEQYKLVKQRTANNFTYFEGSHVMKYGDLGIAKERAGSYEGMMNSGPERKSYKELQKRQLSKHRAVPQREAELVSLRARIARATDPKRKAQLQAELNAELARRHKADSAPAAATLHLLKEPAVVAAVANHMGREMGELQKVVDVALKEVAGKGTFEVRIGEVEAGEMVEEELKGEARLLKEDTRKDGEDEDEIELKKWWRKEKKEKARKEGGKKEKEGERKGYWKSSWVWPWERKGMVHDHEREHHHKDHAGHEHHHKDHEHGPKDHDHGPKDHSHSPKDHEHGPKDHKHHDHKHHDDLDHMDRKPGHKHTGGDSHPADTNDVEDAIVVPDSSAAVKQLQDIVSTLVWSPLPPADAANGILLGGHKAKVGSSGPEGKPLVRDWECLRGMVAAWESKCTALDGYSMQYSRYFANLCNLGLGPGMLKEVVAGVEC